MASTHLQPPNDLRVRANAVAKLKRAASLPRMKDGRRPPMHGEAVSEGERATPSPSPSPSPLPPASEDERDHNEPTMEVPEQDESSSSTPNPAVAFDDQPDVDHEGSDPSAVAVDSVEDSQPDLVASSTAAEEEPESSQSRTTTPTTARKKKRRRPRSRSRSKDLKEMMAAVGRPETPDDSNAVLPPVPISPFLHSTVAVPSPIFPLLPQSQLLHNVPNTPPHPFMSPQAAFFQAPTSPSPLPSLDAIRAGLARSNSAAGRMIAFHKLTGGTESPEPMRLSPSPTPTPALTRSNTVTGGERLAARNIMMRRLGERLKEDAPGIAEETIVTPRRKPVPTDLLPSPASSFKGLQPVKRSPPSNGPVDDREVSETSPNSPISRPLAIPADDSSMSTPVPETPYLAFRPGTSASSSSDYRRTETEGSRITEQEPFEYDGAEVRDGVVIEDEPEGSQAHRQSPFKSPQAHAASQFGILPRHGKEREHARPTDVTSTTSSGLLAEPIPLFMPAQGEKSPYKQDTFPVTISPFGTPNKESIIAESEEEGETVVYPEDIKAKKAWLAQLESDSKVTLSWKSPLSNPESINGSEWEQLQTPDEEEEEEEEEEEDEDEPPLQARSSPAGFNARNLDPRPSTSPYSGHLLTPATRDSLPPETPTDITSPSPPENQGQPDLLESQRTSHASESVEGSSARAPSATPSVTVPQTKGGSSEPQNDWDDVADRDIPAATPEVKEKKKGESTWQKVKTLARSGSSLGMIGGRRSRSNSFVNAKKDESSRESAASANSVNLASPMNPAASTSMLSLSPGSVRGGPSPIPPASAADLARYADQKLMPFPGLAKLQEEKKQRDRGLPTEEDSRPNLERRPSTSNSKSKGPSPTAQLLSESASLSRSNSSHKTNASGADRPMSPGKGVAGPSTSGPRKWLGLGTKKWLPSSSSEAQLHGAVEIVPPGTAMKPPQTESEATNGLELSGSATEKEDTHRHRVALKGLDTSARPSLDQNHDSSALTDSLQEDPASKFASRSETPSESPPLATPSSMQSFPGLGEGSADSGISPKPSFTASQPLRENASSKLEDKRAQLVLAKLDAILEQASRDPARSSALDSPPRKLLLVSKVVQVLGRDSIKDRYLFLFSDILVIAKPLDDGPGHERSKAPLELSYEVRSIVELTKLELHPNDEGPSSSSMEFARHPSVRVFVQQFASDPDRAIATFIEKTNLPDDPGTTGYLLFRTTDLDKTQLGEYLARRTSKNILKAFVDRFGFSKIRIDNALRAFLLSIRLPNDASLAEHLLITFAGRWFEANSKEASFEKDIAARLVFAMMQLNDALHSDLEEDMTPSGGVFSFPNRNISVLDFIDAFRVYDRSRAVPNDVLEKVYSSIKSEKLAQGPDSLVNPIYATITPSSIPGKLTTRVPSERITISIPTPDPLFGIHLQGENLLFEPPFLSFAHSNEASFTVIGNVLGSKTALFARTGPNANKYAGIPLAKTFVVERPFMRNTFRVSFTNHLGQLRNYRYSVDTKEDHSKWTSTLETQIAQSRGQSHVQPIGPVSVKVRRAAEAIALRVLRDSLIVPDESGGQVDADKNAGPKPSFHPIAQPSSRTGQPGELVKNGVRDPKTGQELVVACQQNSLIPLVLSFLNVVKPI